MFKRANNITSLLVAAAAVVSLVPVGISAAEVRTIDAKEGTVYTAASFKDGSYYIDGEDINGNSDSAVYYVSPAGEYKKLEDVNSGSTVYNLMTKYSYINDGEYAVNMTDGTVTDSDVLNDFKDNVGLALKKQIKNHTDDRYSDASTQKTAENIKRYSGNYFWTGYKAKVAGKGSTISFRAKPTDVNKATFTNAFNIYFDANGNYIDADYNLGKIKVNTTGASGSVTIENTKDSKKDSKGGEVKASISDTSTIDHDVNNVYRFATITITSDNAITEINGQKIENNAVFTAGATNGNKTVSYKVIQKISKAAATNKIDGANYAKTVTNYNISKKDGEFIDGLDDHGNITTNTSYFISYDGKFSPYSIDKTNKKVTIRTYDLKSSDGYYYMDEGDKSKEDCEVTENQYAQQTGAVSGSGGILYRLNGGYLYTYNNNGGWDKFYKVDGSFDQFEAENKDNMVLWNKDNKIYSVISTKPVTTTATTTTTAVTAGWVKATDGTWNYNKADGTKATGWIKDGSTWYFLNGLGAMKTGWVNDNGTWYYFKESGAMLANTTIDGYVLGATGAWFK